MAHNTATLTGNERTFGNEFLVSITDTKGVLTYVNDVFIRLAGYSEKELLGQQHNIVRHPDMPRCIFKLLWDTIASGNEIFAYVINKAKNGDHYWVFAHVTPTYDDNNNIIGYLSSRRNASDEALNFIKPLYKQLCNEERRHSSKKSGMQASFDMFSAMLKEKNTSYAECVIRLGQGGCPAQVAA
jgi:PAS domain S-box-containing protein